MSPRENFIETAMYMLEDESTFAMPFRTPSSSKWFDYEIQPRNYTVFMQIHKAYLELKPIAPNKTEFRMIANTDPKFTFLP